MIYAAFAIVGALLASAFLSLYQNAPLLTSSLYLTKDIVLVLLSAALLYLLLSAFAAQGNPQASPTQEQDPTQITKAPPRRAKRRGLILFLALTSLVPLAGYLVVEIHRPKVEQEAYASLQAITELRTSQIESWLAERYQDGDVLAANPQLSAAIEQLAEHPQETKAADQVRQLLLSTLSPLKYEAATIVDPDGIALASVGGFSSLPDNFMQRMYQAFAGELTLFAGVGSDADSRLHADFIIPIFKHTNDDKSPLAAIVLRHVPESTLFPYLRYWPTASQSGETILLRRNGKRIEFLSEVRSKSNHQLSDASLLQPGELFTEIALNAAQLGRLTSGKDRTGHEVLAAYAPVTGTDWIIVSKLDRAEVAGPLHDLAFWVSLITLLAITTVGAMTIIFMNQHNRLTQLEMRTRSDRLLRQFYSMPFIGIAIGTLATNRWMKINDHLCEILGYSRHELLNMGWEDITHPDDLELSAQGLHAITSGDQDSYTMEKRFIRKDGSVVYTSVDVRCVRREDGSPEYLFSTVQNVSKRKEDQDRIVQLTQVYRTLSECNQAIVRCTSAEELFPLICRFAVEHGGMKMACVGLVDELSGDIIPAARHGDEFDLVPSLQLSSDAAKATGRGAAGNAIRQGRPIWIQDFLRDSRTQPWHDRASTAGWRACGALPLKQDGKTVGVFLIHADRVNAFDADMQNLLVELASDISFALTTFAKEATRVRIENALRESESRFRNLYEKAPLPYQSLDIEGHIIEVNDAWLNLLGLERASVIGHYIGEFLDEQSVNEFHREFPQFQEKGFINGPIFTFRHHDGSPRLLMVNGQIARDNDGHFLQMHCIMTDLTERLKSEEQLKLSATVFADSAEGIVITDQDQNILLVNRAFTEITGYPADEAIGHTPRILASGKHDETFYHDMWANIGKAGYWQGELWNRRKTGEIYPEMVSISRVVNEDGNVSHYVGIFSDITEQKASQAHIQWLAHYDSLTGLPNRSLLEDRVTHALTSVERHHQSLALIFLDLDRFKNVNDSLGHRVGDQLLIQVAERLKSLLREDDTISRLGGDEFIIVLPETDADGAAHVAEKVLTRLSQSYQIDHHELSVTPSMGIALYPADGNSYEALTMSADAAMYRAKQAGRNTYRFFTKEMQERSERTLYLENALRKAIDANQLQLFYQPQLALDNQRIVGVEALIRWRHPELGLISPADFIPIAEDIGLILPIGEWVLRTAVKQMRAWLDAGLPPFVMAVNISAVQFRQIDLASLITRILHEYSLPSVFLELELTESVTMEDPEAAARMIDELHTHGIHVSIDDFGTGYSSLSYLKRFKVYKLKIDQSFVRDLSHNPDDAAIVDAIIGLSHSLGLQTLAEGVETKEQMDYLRDKGCNEIQGYLIAKPMPAEEFTKFVLNQASS